MKRKTFVTFLLTMLMSMVGAKAFAYELAVANSDGVTIYYTWTNDNTELSVTYLNEYSADNYSGNVVIPSEVVCNNITYKVTTIGDNAFYGCSGITSVSIPNSVIYIGRYAFESCSSLSSFNIPQSVTSIGSYAFSPTAWFDKQDNGIVYHNQWILGYKGEKPTGMLSVEDGTKGIAGRAFESCDNLTSIVIPNSLTSIGNNAFYETAWFNGQPDGLVYIGKCAYKYKGAMPNNSSIVIKDGTIAIASNAFENCSSLISVTIPEGMKSISDNVLKGCYNLTNVTCMAEDVPSTSIYAFLDSNTENATLHVPAASVAAYRETKPWSNFKTIVEINGNIPDSPEVPQIQKCAKPTISYSNGEISFSCETEGVEYHYNIYNSMSMTGVSSKVTFSPTIIVSVYASKADYQNSETATANIEVVGGLKGDLNGDGKVNAADHVKLSDIILNKE